MVVLVNALSVLNRSGRHVLMGHLSRLTTWTEGHHHYVVLIHEKNQDLVRDLGANVRWHTCPRQTVSWLSRPLWEARHLARLAALYGADFVFNPSGIASLNLDVLQVVFAQNPWCLVRGLKRRPREHIKAVLQRQSYRQSMRRAALMVFNSEYMRHAYRHNAGFPAKHEMVVYQAVADEMHEAARRLSDVTTRNKLQIVTVSVMAPHKGIETVVHALNLLRFQHGIPAQLVLVGSWPDRRYEEAIHSLIHRLQVQSAVHILGHVSDEVLAKSYAESRVFCLMTQCESFGIPAVEAQSFGTPVVSSNCCAIPEVCGEGGLYPAAGDVEGTALALKLLLTEDSQWQRLSSAARQNAQRYRWDIVSRPLMDMFDIVAEQQRLRLPRTVTRLHPA